MTLAERTLGLLHGTFFLRPLLFAVWYPMLVYMLVANAQPSFYHRDVFYAVFALAMRSRGSSIAKTHLILAIVMAIALVIRLSVYGMPRPALLISAIGFVVFSLLLACTEVLRLPPQFELGRYARRRAALAERLDRT